jgi:hypothetical protein
MHKYIQKGCGADLPFACGYRDVIGSRQAKGCKSGLIPSRGKKYIIIITIITMNCEGLGLVPVP